ncbi:MAG: ATP synthase F0 subunit B [Acidobacteria bacterium]|nr:ATP synthase F0 subunit B [Acidobacteriota bacterium]
MNLKSALFSVFAAVLLAGLSVFPETAFAAEEGNPWGAWFNVGRVFNVLLVVGVLVWIARKPLASFFAGRSQAIREELAEAQKARREAEAKLAEIESRMSRLDDELKEIAGAAEREAQDEYQRLLAVAEEDAQKIVERSRQEIEGMTRTAQLELKQHAAELSVQLAEERIRSEITDADRQRLFSRFVTKLGGKS